MRGNGKSPSKWNPLNYLTKDGRARIRALKVNGYTEATATLMTDILDRDNGAFFKAFVGNIDPNALKRWVVLMPFGLDTSPSMLDNLRPALDGIYNALRRLAITKNKKSDVLVSIVTLDGQVFLPLTRVEDVPDFRNWPVGTTSDTPWYDVFAAILSAAAAVADEWRSPRRTFFLAPGFATDGMKNRGMRWQDMAAMIDDYKTKGMPWVLYAGALPDQESDGAAYAHELSLMRGFFENVRHGFNMQLTAELLALSLVNLVRRAFKMLNLDDEMIRMAGDDMDAFANQFMFVTEVVSGRTQMMAAAGDDGAFTAELLGDRAGSE